jgi:glycosyltransferase involved in cell wall biosynthesis
VSDDSANDLGIVAIGRNEGERLQQCLKSAVGRATKVVYVDSGSSDGSVAFARSLGVEVVELDRSIPFTAGRARNAGIDRLQESAPFIRFVQVVDGDCEIVVGWLEDAAHVLRSQPRVAVVCGRRRERYPNASIYNRLCDMEWNTPVGEALSCGGDAMFRLEAFAHVHGYDASVIAGEEPELCLRLRRAGWIVQRIDRDMTLHDANVSRFSQWWRRMVRSGHAYAEGRAMHGKHGHCVREVRSILEWALVIPLLALGLAWLTWGTSLLFLGAYGLLWWRVRNHRVSQGDSSSDASLYANACVIGKFAQLEGMVRYWWNRFSGRRARIIEYKASRHSPSANAVEVGRP